MLRSFALFAVGLALLAPRPADAGSGATFDYLYVAANEGGSSGGHVGIRTGAHVYHFQNQNGLLVLVRAPWEEFVHTYALLANRAIQVSRVGLSPDDEETIRSGLATRHRAQEAQLDVRAALQGDRDLLERMLASPDTSLGPVDVPGLGYFARRPASEERSSSLEALAAALVEAHGATFVAERRRATVRALQEAIDRDPAAWSAPPPVSAYAHPPFAEPWSRRVEAHVAAIAALAVLEEGRVLDPDAVLAPDGPEFALTPEEHDAIRRHRDVSFQQLVRIFRSKRADWGRIALVGMARLAAMDESLATHRIVVLDTLPQAGDRIERRRVARRRGILSEIRSETRRELDVARGFLVPLASDPDPSRRWPAELVWERFEERVNRHVELSRALQGGRDLRIADGHLVPARPAPLEIVGLQLPPRAALEAGLARVVERHRLHVEALEELYGYALMTRNCVTASFETLEDALAGSGVASGEALGGIVDGRSGLGFIPVVSAAQVDGRLRIVARAVIPSHRGSRLAAQDRQGAGLVAKLRESNTLTASTYRRAERDSLFVFFTDGAVLPRPIFGAVNLAAAVGEGGVGLANLPFDRGRMLLSGLKGAAVSLPELAFVNIRKGSNDWIAPSLREWRAEPRDPKLASAPSRPSSAELRTPADRIVP